MKILASRWFLILPFILAAIILAGWYALWRAGGDIMRAEVDRFVADERARGVRLDHDALRVEGFPFLLRGRIGNVVYVDGAVRLETDQLYIDALPYDLDRLIFSLAGTQRIGLGDARYDVTTKDARASIENDAARGWLLRAQAEAVTVDRSRPDDNSDDAAPERALGETTLTRASTGPFLVNIAPQADDPFTLEASLTMTEPALAGITAGGAPASVKSDGLEAFAALSRTDQLARARDWRAAGGTLDVRTFSITSGESAFSAAGVLTLDPDGYPAGIVNARIEKPQGLADLLRDAGVLSAEEARALAGGLGFAAVAGGGTVSAPIELRAGHARLLGMRLAPLPRIDG